MSVFSRFARYFDEVSQRGSLRQAGERLNIAPSAIDRQILQVEDELGTALFERHPQGMRLTAAGEHLIYNIRRWQREFDRVREHIQSLQGLQGGRATIAIGEALASEFLAGHLVLFHERYPRVTLTVAVVGTGGVREKIVSGEADVGITFTSTAVRGIRVEHAVSLPLGVATLPDHPLAGQRVVTLRDCLSYPVIIPEESILLRGLIETSAAKAGLDVAPVAISNSFAMMKSLVLKGLGIALMTRIEVLGEIAAGRLIFRELSATTEPPPIVSVVTALKPSIAGAQLSHWLATALSDLR